MNNTCDFCLGAFFPQNYNYCPVCGRRLRERKSFAEQLHEFEETAFELGYYLNDDDEDAQNDTSLEETEEVNFNAQLDQVAEESCELGQACMKLKRAIGNGNPCNVSASDAFKKVIEEYSDVIVAGNILMDMIRYRSPLYMPDRSPIDVHDYMVKVARFKIKRRKERLEESYEG